MNIVSTKSIISFLGKEKRIKDHFSIEYIKPPDELVNHALTFLSREEEFEELFRSAPQKVLAVIPASLEKKSKAAQNSLDRKNKAIEQAVELEKEKIDTIKASFKQWRINALEEVAKLKLKNKMEKIDKAGLKDILGE